MRLLVPALAAGRVEVRGDGLRHLRVLRVRAGDRLVLFDGAGAEADAVVLSVEADVALLEATAPRAGTATALRLTLLVALLKGEKMELVVQKATELGVAAIVPMAAAHSVVRLDEARGRARVERWRKIAAEAARQCGRADVPSIAPAASVAEALGAAPPDAQRLMLHEQAERPLGLALGGSDEIVVAVGPEGGFAPDELDAARAAGYAIVGLGPRVLRAETAAIAVVAILGFAAGDVGR